MTRYHVNPDNGNAGPCRATKNCPFGGPMVHFDTIEKARQAYELSMAPQALEATKKAEAARAVPVMQAAQFNALFVSEGEAPAHFALIEKRIEAEDVEEAFRKFSERPPKGLEFKTLMGDVRITNRRVAEYHDKLRHHIASDPKLSEDIARRAAGEASAKAYARAYKAGVAIPAHQEQAFEHLWTGDFRGQEFFVSRGQELQELQQGLRDRRYTPAQIVGTGYRNADQVAQEWLHRQLLATGEAILTRGRSDFLNVDVVRRQHP